MAKVDELFVEIKGDVSDLIKKLKEATDSTKSTTDRMGSAFKGVGAGIAAGTKALGTFGLAIQGAQAVMAPFSAVLDQINSKAGILRTAKNLGVASDKFQEFTYAAKLYGATQEDVSDVIKDFGIRVGEAAEGSESMITALNRIGLSAENLIRMKPEQQFEALADAIMNSSEEAARLSLDEMISDPGIRMVGVLRQGSLGLSNMASEARELNQVISESKLGEMEDAAKSVTQLKMAFEGLMNEAIIHLAPIMKEFLGMTIDGIKELNQLLGITVTLEDKEKRLAELTALREKNAKRLNDLGRSGKNAKMFEAQYLKEIKQLEEEILEIRKRSIDTGKMHGPFQSSGDSGGSLDGMFNMEEEYSKKYGDEDSAKEKGSVIAPSESVIEEELARLEEALHQKEILELESERAKAEEMQRIRDNEYSAEEYQYKRIIALAQGTSRDKLRLAKGMANDLLAISKGSSRKLFEVSKALGIADATVSAITGATNAFRDVPYPMNFVASAAVLAAGMANVQRIASTDFNGGGGTGGGSSGVGQGNSEVQQPQEVVQTTNFDVTLQGDSFSGDQIRGLIGQINEATDDGVKLNAVMVQ